MLDACPNIIAGHGNSWSPYERGLGERAWKQPMAKAPHEVFASALLSAPLLSPSGTSSSCLDKAGRSVLHSGVLGELKHLQPHCLIPREPTAAALLSPSCHPSTCSPPAPAGSHRPLLGTAGLFMPWRLAHLVKDPLWDGLSCIWDMRTTKFVIR